MTNLKNPILIFAATMLLCSPLKVAGQQAVPQGGQQKDQGGQQGQVPTPVSAEEPTQPPEGGAATTTPSDARSFGGAEGFTVQSPAGSRGYFLPSFQFSEMGDSNFTLGGGSHSFETIETVVGRLNFNKVTRRARTTVEYMGGGTFYNHHSDLNNTMQQFGITESYQGRRWSLMLDDRATYLPESTFGYGGFGFGGGLGVDLGGATGSALSNLNPSFNPNEALFTGRGSRVLNTSVVQVQYLAGARSSLTLAASYGFLHFTSGGLTGSRNGTIMLGYSHSLTARDYIGLNYAVGRFLYPSLGTSFTTHMLQASYGHKISGRMAMQVGAGPQVNVIKNPASGSSTPVSWSAQSSLNYRARKGSALVYYFRNTTNGGGVLTGATTDSVSFSWSTDLMRRWSASIGPGYAHNRSIPQTTTNNTQSVYDSEYVNASLSRSVGRHASMFLTYTFQTQSANVTPCSFATCGSNLQRHLVGVGFDFHPRQITGD